MKEEEVVSALQKHAAAAAEWAVNALERPLDERSLAAFLNSEYGLRVPTEIVFDGARLDTHQFAQPEFIAEGGKRRCVLHIHPKYEALPETHALIVAYMAGAINYGAAADAELCETYGAALTGMEREAFYRAVCRIADR